jgi:carboxypeptidase D
VTATSEEDIAKDFNDFFLNFQTIFGIKKFKIFVTGESYAGRYVPYISVCVKLVEQVQSVPFEEKYLL